MIKKFNDSIDRAPVAMISLSGTVVDTTDSLLQFFTDCEELRLFEGFIYRNGRGRAARYRTWMKIKDEL